MTPEQIRAIIQLLPTTEEKRQLNTYLSRKHTTIGALCECEKFMVAMLKVRHAKRKLDALLFIKKFSTTIEELLNGELFWSCKTELDSYTHLVSPASLTCRSMF